MIIQTRNWITNNNPQEKLDARTSLTSSPNRDITMSENMRNYQFEPVLNNNTRTHSELIIQPNAYIQPGETLTINGLLSNITLTASVSPNSNDFLTTSSVPTPAFIAQYLLDVAESIAYELLSNLSFRNNYNVIVNGTQIRLIAKQFGSDYDLTFSSTSTVFINNTITGFTEFLTQDVIDYQCFAEVYAGIGQYGENVDKYQTVLLDEYLIDSKFQTANINAQVVSNYVEPIKPLYSIAPSDVQYFMDQAILSNGLSNPDLNYNGVQKRLLIPYFILYGDSFKYTSINSKRKKTTEGVTGVKWVQLGALDQLLPYDLMDYTWVPNLSKTFKWLTSSPNIEKKSVTYDSHEYLQAICKKTSNNGNYRLKVTYTFYDGTSLIDLKTDYNYSNKAGNVSFNVSPLALDIKNVELNNNKLVKYYTIVLLWDNNGGLNNFSQTKSYVFDRNCYKHKHQIIFLNEFGAWDSLEFRGSKTESVDTVSQNVIQRVIPFNANTLDSISDEISLNVENDTLTSYTINSGLMHDEFIKHSNKLIDSTSVYIFDESVRDYRSIQILNHNIVYDSNVLNNSINVTFKYTTNNNTISR